MYHRNIVIKNIKIKYCKIIFYITVLNQCKQKALLEPGILEDINDVESFCSSRYLSYFAVNFVVC